MAWHTSSLKLGRKPTPVKFHCLKRYVFPVIGAMDIAEIETVIWRNWLRPLTIKAYDVAGRVRQH